jgi:hypothetical protein
MVADVVSQKTFAQLNRLPCGRQANSKEIDGRFWVAREVLQLLARSLEPWRLVTLVAAIFGINSCHQGGLIYNGQVRLNGKFLWLVVPVAFALLGAGCAGINTGASVSPASFFLPGILKNDPPAATNAPVALTETSVQLVSVK